MSGVDVDLLDPTPDQIRLGDIAHALSRLARFNGHTVGEYPWSVAQHSLLVESLLPEDASPQERLVALLHDAHEAYLGDIVSPIFIAVNRLFESEMKMAGRVYGVAPSTYLKQIASRLDKAIFAAFGIVEPSSRVVERVRMADLLTLRIEADALMPPRGRDWPILPPAPDPAPVLRPCHPPERAKAVFLDRFRILRDMRHGL